jgi:AcrR family transcriptional regulator
MLADVTEPEGTAPKRRRMTQAEAKEQTRQQLLAAAASVFARKGFGGASLEEIAETAGYTTGALYYNFAGKEELFLELLNTGMTRQASIRAEAFSRAFSEPGADPFDTLSALAAARADRTGELAALNAEFWLYAVRNPDVMKLLTAKLSEQDKAIEPAVTTMMEKLGTPPEITPAEMALITDALFAALVRRRRLDPDAVPDDLFARVLRRLFTAG